MKIEFKCKDLENKSFSNNWVCCVQYMLTVAVDRNMLAARVNQLSHPCVTQGEALSTLTVDDTSRLGELSCELSASQLRLMDPDVLKATLEDMALCRYIPADHRSDLIQLIEETYG